MLNVITIQILKISIIHLTRLILNDVFSQRVHGRYEMIQFYLITLIQISQLLLVILIIDKFYIRTKSFQFFLKSKKAFVELFDDATTKKVEEEIILPNQNQVITQYFPHSFVLNKIHFFHYLISKGIYNQIDDLCMEVMQFGFYSPIQKEKMEQQN
ncbi:unnamed protein product [Paramecium sonneborni]|uniref:Transmembrane protein n=1 Tax=Paramecium sonneborni TaxID=65129 RepID=A0A8S1L0J8_9CILI|nr:unnamed protein product [Paramecium sonneborni]